MGACPISIIASAEYPLITVSSAGNTTLMRQAPITTQRVAVDDASGSYTASISLSNIEAQSGDIFRVIAVMADSMNPIFQVIDLLTGIVLATVTGSGTAFISLIEATFNGLSWDFDAQSA